MPLGHDMHLSKHMNRAANSTATQHHATSAFYSAFYVSLFFFVCCILCSLSCSMKALCVCGGDDFPADKEDEMRFSGMLVECQTLSLCCFFLCVSLSVTHTHMHACTHKYAEPVSGVWRERVGSAGEGREDRDECMGGERRCKGWMEEEWIRRRGGWIVGRRAGRQHFTRKECFMYSAQTASRETLRDEGKKGGKGRCFHSQTALFHMVLMVCFSCIRKTECQSSKSEFQLGKSRETPPTLL